MNDQIWKIEKLIKKYEKLIICNKKDSYVSLYREKIAEKEHMELLELDEKEMTSFGEVYYLYEFTNKICVISDSNQYGSMINYLTTGILTMDEYVEALLYERKQ